MTMLNGQTDRWSMFYVSLLPLSKVKHLLFHQKTFTAKTDFLRGPDMEQTEYLQNTRDSTTRQEMDVKV